MKGVVGWVDLCSPDLPAQLDAFAANRKLVGVRHVLQGEPDDEFMLRTEFRRGIARLAEYGLTYDLLLYPRHLPVAMKLVREFPEQRFVLDHIAKPAIAEGLMEPWERDIRELARFGNVFCKLSGMVTEARWKQWTPEDFGPISMWFAKPSGEATDDRFRLASLHVVGKLRGDNGDGDGLREAITP